MTKPVFDASGITLDGVPFYLASGDFHYFRCMRNGWERRLRLMKDFGLTAVQTYVPWNLHEPEEGVFDFSDNLDLAAFLRLCSAVGLKVLMRPSPYICSEWDFGGLPYRLLRNRSLTVRSSDAAFLSEVSRYYDRLAEEILPYLATRGGPVIAVAVENEYGSIGRDTAYLQFLVDKLVSVGVDVPFYTADGDERALLLSGSVENAAAGVDLHALHKGTFEAVRSVRPDKPFLVSEFWGGCCMKWGKKTDRRSPENVAAAYRELLETGAYVNFYMFCGGTNFGYMNGALLERDPHGDFGSPPEYVPFVTSYDTDALVDEAGRPTEKYYLCRKVLKDYLTSHGIRFTGSDDIHALLPIQKEAVIPLTKSADLLDNIDLFTVRSENSAFPRCMEDLGQAYGYTLYRTFLPYIDGRTTLFTLENVRDRAAFFVNGSYVDTLERNGKEKTVRITAPKEGATVDILVENSGRVNFGPALFDDRKGIVGKVLSEAILPDGSRWWPEQVQLGFENRVLDLERPVQLDLTKTVRPGRPSVWEGNFSAVPGVDGFLLPDGCERGIVLVNGFHIGRYRTSGPQRTLYIPGELLQAHNTVRLFDFGKTASNVSLRFVAEPILDSLSE